RSTPGPASRRHPPPWTRSDVARHLFAAPVTTLGRGTDIKGRTPHRWFGRSRHGFAPARRQRRRNPIRPAWPEGLAAVWPQGHGISKMIWVIIGMALPFPLRGGPASENPATDASLWYHDAPGDAAHACGRNRDETCNPS